MRLKSSIFVSALIRLESSKGAFCAVLNKGAEEAGAIFLVHLMPGGKASLYGPAPQSALDHDDTSDRYFEIIGEKLSVEELDKSLQTQKRFDPDCWIVEIEKVEPLDSVLIMSE